MTGKKISDRIDKDTSGLLMTLKTLQQHLVDKTIQKHYLCLAKGRPALNEQRIDQPLLRYTLGSGERRVKVEAYYSQNGKAHKPKKVELDV